MHLLVFKYNILVNGEKGKKKNNFFARK